VAKLITLVTVLAAHNADCEMLERIRLSQFALRFISMDPLFQSFF
jgi:hypothetical protein